MKFGQNRRMHLQLTSFIMLTGVWGLNKKDHTYTMVDNYYALYNYQPDSPPIKHPCDRICVKDEQMICKYKFDISIYSTITKNLAGDLVGKEDGDVERACGDCPNTVSDCFKPLCISADGAERGVVAVNRQMPGPPIGKKHALKNMKKIV